MPGFNQQGPSNQGPMTGRGMGRCTNDPMATSPNFGRGQFRDQGAGFRRGRGQGRGPGRGQGFVQGPMAAQAPGTMEDLKLRAQALESELNAVKEALAKL
ncbi:MAG: DUF5320 domain-containing protein [Desulfobacteraceae bacterium]|nr:DUF5320 domain-containing protein [Desulfobacteraceae bacterium]